MIVPNKKTSGNCDGQGYNDCNTKSKTIDGLTVRASIRSTLTQTGDTYTILTHPDGSDDEFDYYISSTRKEPTECEMNGCNDAYLNGMSRDQTLTFTKSQLQPYAVDNKVYIYVQSFDAESAGDVDAWVFANTYYLIDLSPAITPSGKCTTFSTTAPCMGGSLQYGGDFEVGKEPGKCDDDNGGTTCTLTPTGNTGFIRYIYNIPSGANSNSLVEYTNIDNSKANFSIPPQCISGTTLTLYREMNRQPIKYLKCYNPSTDSYINLFNDVVLEYADVGVYWKFSSTCNQPSDTNHDCVITRQEVAIYANLWVNGQGVTRQQVGIDANIWVNGGHY